jgi:hypothetical protein
MVGNFTHLGLPYSFGFFSKKFDLPAMKILLIISLTLSGFFAYSQKKIVGITRSQAIIFPIKLTGKPIGIPIEIAAGDSVTLVKFIVKTEIWNVKYKQVSGTLEDAALMQNDAVVQFKNVFINRDYKTQMIKKYGALYGNDIYNGSVRPGMTKAMVNEVYGKPDEVNRTGGSWGVHEQWVYAHRSSGKTEYLYFENNKLSSWQD